MEKNKRGIIEANLNPKQFIQNTKPEEWKVCIWNKELCNGAEWNDFLKCVEEKTQENENLKQQIRSLEQKCEELNKDRCDRDEELHQIYSHLGVEAFGEDIHEQALKEIAKLHEQLKNAIVPKFKIGQKVYLPSTIPVSTGGSVMELVVKGFIPDDYDLLVILEDKDKERFELYQKSLFATREEAEKRLAELKG